jgi:hypothetical protein
MKSDNDELKNTIDFSGAIRFNNFRYSMIADLFPAEEDKRSIDMAQDAVVVRYAHKRYSKSQAPILDGLNMTVPRGSM